MQKISCLAYGLIWGMHMKVINWKSGLYILLGLAAVVCCVNWFASGQIFKFMFIVQSISLSVFIISLFSAVFCAKLWKWSLFKKWLVLIPDMNGVWEGSIETTWVDPHTKRNDPPIFADLTIKQSLFSISCVMKTSEMRSSSINAGFLINSDNQEFQLIYTYLSVPKQNIQSQSRIHYGTIIFDLDKNYDVTELSGNYWTGRKTVGSISMVKRK